jgi:hypothetical protein
MEVLDPHLERWQIVGIDRIRHADPATIEQHCSSSRREEPTDGRGDRELP